MKGIIVACLLLSGLLLCQTGTGAAELFQKGVTPEIQGKANIFAENNLVRISVEDTAGGFGIGTSSTHPTRPCQRLLYGFSCGGTSQTSHIMANVDGVIWLASGYTNGCSTNVATYVSSTVVTGTIESRWTIPSPPVSVLVRYTPIDFGGGDGSMLIETILTNNDAVPHNLGAFYEFDTQVAANDAAELAAGGQWYPNETCFDNPQFTYWEAFESTVPPGPNDLVGRGTIAGGMAVMPDRLALGAYGYFFNVCWDYTCVNQDYGDSAVMYWWNPQPVAPGNTRRVATYYGIGEIQTTPGELTISLSYTTALTCNSGSISPNPFGLTAYVTNAGSSVCTGVSAALALTNGLSTTDPLAQSLGSINPSQTVQAYWDVTATLSRCDMGIPFSVSLTSSTCDPNTANGSVYVPCCPTPTPAPVPAASAAGFLALIAALSLFAIKSRRR